MSSTTAYSLLVPTLPQMYKLASMNQPTTTPSGNKDVRQYLLASTTQRERLTVIDVYLIDIFHAAPLFIVFSQKVLQVLNENEFSLLDIKSSVLIFRVDKHTVHQLGSLLWVLIRWSGVHCHWSLSITYMVFFSSLDWVKCFGEFVLFILMVCFCVEWFWEEAIRRCRHWLRLNL